MTQYSDKPELNALTLGQATAYVSAYTPSLLQAVPRQLNRQELGVVEEQPFAGEDVWHAYELSWLNPRGKPIVALARFSFAASTVNLVESKSFKLYLNSFNQSRFESHAAVREALLRDLANVAVGPVTVELIAPDDVQTLVTMPLPGKCIDELDIDIDAYQLAPNVLRLRESDAVVSETLHSHLLKSNCLITNQPDWASVIIEYQGAPIDHESLLRYLVSFRLHNEFHEQCVERIYMDILNVCQPSRLAVQALYTRRGGLDICPFRASKANQGVVSPRRRINRQ
ncbi:NADPH-dependent 7-cyano-7-deazaguanine reductase QueF [Arenicella xantha]|uniref:NADPH-dependent 7-cyano-7-deazaguanine reductase n=1 Tax=Arenicella xantha TaxID=644221 RepID=A0A395JPI3_9GAMM|nr:NADPH-dependent 7-cyano-7-deazaguanine reductase QueF [Arenicella xantha]RBP51707.1 7-cyano-7-deazaguanine reductase [Arenicella xantha]